MLKKFLLLFIGLGMIFLNPTYIFAQYQSLYDVLPDVANCKTGTLKQSEKDKMLEALNKVRDLHKLPHFEYDKSFDDEAMEISLICCANGKLEHKPDPSYQCYSQTGYNGGISTNLWGSGSNSYPSEASIKTWMNDVGQPSLGHRRWIVNPFIKKIAFGRVDGKTKTTGQDYCAMSFYYDSQTNQDLSNLENDFVAVPYGDYPPSLWDFGWSEFSFTVIADKSDEFANGGKNASFSTTSSTGETINSAYVEVEDESGNVTTFKFDDGSLGCAHDDGYGVPNYCYWWMKNIPQQKVYKVRVFDVLVNGQKRNYSYQFAFRDPFIEKPGEPVLSNPADNTTEVNPNVNLQWGTAQGATYYIVQVSKDDGFGSENVIYTNNDVNKTSVQLSGVLEPIKKYYWRVAGRNDAGTGDWSSVWSFTTTTAPDEPTIVGPADNATDVSLTPTLSWGAANKADKYQLQVANNDNFSSTLVDKPDITATQYTLEEDILAPVTKYWWRVRSISNISGQSAWSAVRAFTTAAAAPGKPDLLAPALGAKNVSGTPQFEWAIVPGAGSYDLQVCPFTGYDPTDLVFDSTGIKNNYYKLRPFILELETQYFWRVRAIGPGGASDWSRNGRFTVGDASPVFEMKIPSSSIEVFPNPVTSVATFDIEILKNEFVSLKIFNNLGEQVETIFETEMRVGNYIINYDLSNVPSGIYYYQLIGSKTNVSGKLNVMN